MKIVQKWYVPHVQINEDLAIFLQFLAFLIPTSEPGSCII